MGPDSLIPSDRIAWRAVDDRSASVSQTLFDETIDATITVDPHGRIEEFVVQRWGTPPGGDLGLHSFG
ncbi:MAG: DUF6544 family protein [Actinomycetota bacterium]